ncbi:hypothetical protein BJY52DRAFT_1282919 [Lactarius psammicola]|nr:hypothetical protein BJY52DRAFT_1282919 [Lactarius psammicola]
MMQRMPVRRISQNWDDLIAQSNDLYFNGNVLESGLQLSETHEEFPSNDVYDQFLGNYNETLEQFLNRETYGEPGDAQNLGYLQSCATATHPSFLPTPTGELSLGETPSEGGVTNWQSNEVVVVGLSTRVHELQLESPTPSTSNLAAGLGKKPRKKEESGVCGQCNKKFSRKSDVRRHEIAVHEGEGYMCELCDTPCCRKDASKCQRVRICFNTPDND